MGWLEDKLTRWAHLIYEHAGPGIAEQVIGYDDLEEASPEELAAWSRRAMERLAELVPDVATREKIMEGRACVFVQEFGDEPLLELRKIYKETGGVDAVFDAMARDREKHSRPRREGDVIYETKAPRDGEALATAQAPDEKRVAYCHCPLARAGVATTPQPEPYCCCGGGWYGRIWEFIVERQVGVFVVRSVMRGDDDCTFAVHLPPGVAG